MQSNTPQVRKSNASKKETPTVTFKLPSTCISLCGSRLAIPTDVTHHFFHVNTSRHTHISFYASTSNVETPLSVTPIGIEVPTNSTIFPVRSATSFPSIFRLYCHSSCYCFSARCFSSRSSVSFFSAFLFSSLSSSSFLAFSVPGSTSS